MKHLFFQQLEHSMLYYTYAVLERVSSYRERSNNISLLEKRPTFSPLLSPY